MADRFPKPTRTKKPERGEQSLLGKTGSPAPASEEKATPPPTRNVVLSHELTARLIQYEIDLKTKGERFNFSEITRNALGNFLDREGF
ncbi:hypothetical protein [Desulfovibrio ferrophilus]|uniref:Uncharacterized protein n=1 Tax=Desulfovibrio ferrophilus TaxID=241368 RepID=A0A2Z6B3Q3_9BACT|nr:hypothetical protein [Desulfovibrio ferrophilus]BBD10139.1 putative uncharacterized protein [Desulfovibrio ferrophilus]